eukprot:1186053-Prorocentrum_minimum.AAC.1
MPPIRDSEPWLTRKKTHDNCSQICILWETKKPVCSGAKRVKHLPDQTRYSNSERLPGSSFG